MEDRARRVLEVSKRNGELQEARRKISTTMGGGG